MAESTYDTIKNRGSNIDAAVDGATAGTPAPASAAAPTPAPKAAPVQGTHNPDNLLPDNESIFHKVARGFGLTK